MFSIRTSTRASLSGEEKEQRSRISLSIDRADVKEDGTLFRRWLFYVATLFLFEIQESFLDFLDFLD